MVIMRKAHARDMEEIWELADGIFEREQNIPRELSPIPDEQKPQWWCAEAEHKIIGTAVLYCDHGTWHMGRIAVLPEMRGQHIATKLLEYVLKNVFLDNALAQDIEEIYFEARDTTVHILQKFGAEIIGEPFPFYLGTVTPVLLKKTAFMDTLP